MNHIILLIVIYLSFIGLGIPDAVLGSAWPAMHTDLNIQLSYAGIITMIISGGTIISSFYSDKVIEKFGVAKTTSYSTLITALALLGFSQSTNFWWLCFLAIPYGLGAGSIDAALNNFVAINYEAKHMNWLHCSWGIGAAAGPIIMGQVLSHNLGWRNGYIIIAIFQIILSIFLFSTLKLWISKKEIPPKETLNQISKKIILKIAGVKEVLIAFFCYCSLETATGLWAASYLVIHYNYSIETAASFAAIFYIGITLGRFLCGFISMKMNDKQMINIGLYIISSGIILLLIPKSGITTITGLIFIGLGCAPIYPALIHSTPSNFGEENSQSIIGMQMASAYVGTTFMPAFFGLIQKYTGISFYPIFLAIFAITMIIFLKKMHKLVELK